MRIHTVFASIVLFCTGLCARADSLVGSTIDVRYLFPNTSATYKDFGPQTVSAGLTDVVTGVANITFSSGQVVITNTVPSAFSVSAFSGFDVMFLPGTTITSALFDASSNAQFLPGAILIFGANDIRVNLSGTCSTCTTSGQLLIINVGAKTAVATTPEPSSLVLAATGALALAGFVRRRFV